MSYQWERPNTPLVDRQSIFDATELIGAGILRGVGRVALGVVRIIDKYLPQPPDTAQK